jgi:ATP-binding cassette subfamily B protein
MSSSGLGGGYRRNDDLPPALRSMWRLFKLGYQHEPALLVAAFSFALLQALPDALIALWLKLMSDGVTRGDRGLLAGATAGLALSSIGSWFLRVVQTRVERRFRDRVTIALEGHVARLQASVSTLAHQERPELLDRLAVLRNHVFVLDHMYGSVFAVGSWLIRLGVTLVLLATISPVLLLLVVFALPPVLTASRRPAAERAAEERGAPSQRLSRHLFQTVTTAAPGKEVRLDGTGAALVERRRASWEAWYAEVSRARWASAAWHSLAWAIFGAAYVGAIVFVASGLHSPAGSVLLVVAAGARLSGYVGGAVGEIGFLRGIWLDGARRLAWLEDYARSQVDAADLPAPAALSSGITLEHVSFAYPGTDRLVLEDVSVALPAGSVVAVVGENGAGKSTLVKLLCRLYLPTSGRILVDGTDLARIEPDSWRARTAGTFQDFVRFEFLARQSVGLGDVPRVDSVPAVTAAVGRGGAQDVVDRMPSGLESQLGATWPAGIELSFGQWQKLALSRGFMRDEPLLVVLDEPTAALDAETEHAVFERYTAALRGAAASGRVSILVSHRFSTVRSADLIVVLDGSHVVEVGSHADLLAAGGRYAELYNMQAAAYR